MTPLRRAAGLPGRRPLRCGRAPASSEWRSSPVATPPTRHEAGGSEPICSTVRLMKISHSAPSAVHNAVRSANGSHVTRQRWTASAANSATLTGHLEPRLAAVLYRVIAVPPMAGSATVAKAPICATNIVWLTTACATCHATSAAIHALLPASPTLPGPGAAPTSATAATHSTSRAGYAARNARHGASAVRRASSSGSSA